jgi:glucan 1,3-beta-glucosidase
MGFVVIDIMGRMTKALRGINLGGWLVAERWMTPDLFAGVEGDGEIALVRELGYDTAKMRLQAHRNAFITEEDFRWIATHGFEFVRLPVGYWLFSETDDFIDGETHLRRAFEWAHLHDLKVVLDFHGLQGSQNGQDHSGQVGKIRFYQRGNRQQALETLEYMCRTYGGNEALLAIELINEPKTRWFLWGLLRYYDRAVAIAERYLAPTVQIIVSDAFKPRRMARALSRRAYGNRVVLDVHLYRVFGRSEQGLTTEEHISAVENDWRELLQELSKHVPVMVGEWSAALPARADQEGRNAEYFNAQQQVFNDASWAHSYWSYKAPGCGAWDYRTRSEFH